jgi:hypothetical protein
MTTAVFVAAQHPEIVKPLAGKHYAGSSKTVLSGGSPAPTSASKTEPMGRTAPTPRPPEAGNRYLAGFRPECKQALSLQGDGGTIFRTFQVRALRPTWKAK